MSGPAAGTGQVTAYAALALASMSWAGTGLVGKAVFAEISPAALACWMWGGGALLAWPFVARELREQWPVIRRSWKVLVLLSLLSTSPFSALVFRALHDTTATNHALLNSTVPMWVLLMSWLALRRRPQAGEFAGFALSMAGVAMILFQGELANVTRFTVNPADLLIVLGMIIWAAHTLLFRHRPQTLSPLAYVVVAGGIGGLAMLPLYAWDLAQGQAHPSFSTGVLAAIGYVVVLRTIVSTMLFNFGLGRVGALRATPFTHLVPVFGSVGAFVFLDEAFRTYHLAGFALVLAGILVANRRL